MWRALSCHAALLCIANHSACSVRRVIFSIINLASQYHQSKLSLDVLNRIMTSPVDREKKRNYLNRQTLKGDITFDNVFFFYFNFFLYIDLHKKLFIIFLALLFDNSIYNYLIFCNLVLWNNHVKTSTSRLLSRIKG